MLAAKLTLFLCEGIVVELEERVVVAVDKVDHFQFEKLLSVVVSEEVDLVFISRSVRQSHGPSCRGEREGKDGEGEGRGERGWGELFTSSTIVMKNAITHG